MEGVQRELNERYDKAIALDKTPAPDQLPSLGVTSWRPIDGEEHLINPQTIYLLQCAVREGDYGMFKEYSAACHVPGRAVTLRDLLDFAPQESPVPIRRGQARKRDRQALQHGRHELRLHLQGSA